MQGEKNRQADKAGFDAILAQLQGRDEVHLVAETEAQAIRIRYLFYAARKLERKVGNPLWAKDVVVRVQPLGDGKWDLCFCRGGYDASFREMLALAGITVNPSTQGAEAPSPVETLSEATPTAPDQGPAQGPDGSHQAEALSRIFGGGLPGLPKEGS